MKVFGTIKQSFPVNAFTPVIFVDTVGNYFTQIESNGKIEGFEPIEITEEDILKVDSTLEPKKNGSTIYCYTQECNSILIGTLFLLKEKMYELINGEKINTVAKAIISSKYKIHNKTAIFVKMSNMQFKKDNLNCKLHLRNYIKVTEYTDENLKTIYNSFSNIHRLIAKKENIEWADFIDISEKRFYVDNFKIEIDLLFSSTKSNNDENEIKQKLFDTIVHRVDNKRLNKNVLTINKNFYLYIFSTSKRISILDKIPFMVEVPDEVKYMSEIDFEKYGDKTEEIENIDNKKIKRILRQAEDVKKSFQRKKDKNTI